MRALTLTCIACLLVVGCSLPKLKVPRVHRITVQQGNVITQDMVDKLKPGMSRSQVAFIMGEPVLRNTFNDTRWDYIYIVDVPGVFNNETRMSLYFENDVLAYFTGDLAPTSATGNEGEADTDSPEVSEDSAS